MRKICYTAIFGNYDELKEPSVISEGWEYIVFSDRHYDSKVWKTIIINEGLDNKIQARKCWVKPFDYIDYDICVSVGGQISIHCDLNEFVDYSKEFSIMQHPYRNCVYAEAYICLKHNIGVAEKITEQMRKYFSEGLPINVGLVETGVMVRRNTENNKKHCSLWFDEILNHSYRDQLSFNYILWKHKLITPNLMYWENLKDKFIIHPHIK
jgi:hypothetical protein